MAENAFYSIVRNWLNSVHTQRRPIRATAAEIYAVQSEGADMAGDTDCGFHAEFEVTIKYLGDDGKRYQLDIDGEDMDSLWRHVVNAAWPATLDLDAEREFTSEEDGRP